MNQIQEVADRLALRALVEQYAKGADNRSPELFGGAFTKDGVLNTSRGEVIGGEAIAALAPKLARYRATMHLIGNHYVDFVDDDHAKGETYFLLELNREEKRPLLYCWRVNSDRIVARPLFHSVR